MKVRVIENAWVAKWAAKKLNEKKVAMVLGHAIYLYNVSKQEFLESKTWVCHELAHVKQFEQNGYFVFIFKYIVEYLKKGYSNNKYEVEARNSEMNDLLLKEYSIE